MTDKSVFIVTENLPSVGDALNLRLSFPRAVKPILVNVLVTQVRLPTGPGIACGFVAEFDTSSAATAQQKRIDDIARRLHKAKDTNEKKSLALLLVEDNQLIRDMFAYAVEQYFLHRPGRVQLVLAPSVDAALAALEDRGGADLVLVDHFLQPPTGESGTSLITKLRAHPQLHRIPIVGMSAGGIEIQRAMLAAGADLFLNKPIALRDFFCTVEFLMDAEPESTAAAE